MQSPIPPSLSQITISRRVVVINVMFNTLKPLSTVSERTAKKIRMRENDKYRKVVYFELPGVNCMKMITTGQIFLLNYELSVFFKYPGKFV
jgi:hypothetical protein